MQENKSTLQIKVQKENKKDKKVNLYYKHEFKSN